MEKIFVVFVSRHDKQRAVAETIKTGENLMNYIKRYNCAVCHICKNRTEAEMLAREWNKNYGEQI